MYKIHTVEGSWEKLQVFLNSLAPGVRVISVHPGKHGKWHGLAEEYEFGFKVIVEELAK